MKKYLCHLLTLSSLFLLLTSCSAKLINEERLSAAITKSQMNVEKIGPQINCRKLPLEELIKDFKQPCMENANVFVIEEQNLPIGSNYLLFTRKLDGITMFIDSYKVNKDQKLVSTTKGNLLSKFLWHMGSFFPGEELAFFLLNTESDEYLVALAFPNPIEATWDDGAYACLHSCSRGMDCFLLDGKGFLPNEPLVFISISEGEYIYNEAPADPLGGFNSMLLPAVIGKPTGNSKVIIQRTLTGELRSLDYTYGRPDNAL